MHVVQGDNVRPRGGDVAAGDVVVPRGTRLGPAQIGALAAAGLDRVVVGRRPRVAVLSTGTELRRPGEPLGPGQVYEANGVLLAATFASVGGDVDAAYRPSPTTSPRTALRSSVASPPMCSSPRAASPSDRTISFAGSWATSASRRSSGASPSSRESPWRSECAGPPSCSGSPAIRSPLLSAPKSSCGLLCSPSRVRLSLALFSSRAGSELRSGATLTAMSFSGRVPPRPRTAFVLDPVIGQESHMIARAAAADALVLAPRGEGELAGRREGALPAARLSGRLVGLCPARLDAQQPRIGDVPVRREEARVACL